MYIGVTEGHVTFGTWKDILHLGHGRTYYIQVTEGHATFELRKDKLNLGNGRTSNILLQVNAI